MSAYDDIIQVENPREIFVELSYRSWAQRERIFPRHSVWPCRQWTEESEESILSMHIWSDFFPSLEKELVRVPWGYASRFAQLLTRQ